MGMKCNKNTSQHYMSGGVEIALKHSITLSDVQIESLIICFDIILFKSEIFENGTTNAPLDTPSRL